MARTPGSWIALIFTVTLWICPRPASADATPTPTPQQLCYGDCTGDGAVTIDELITLVNIALGNATVDACPQALDERFCPGEVFVDCILRAVNNALVGCPSATPTATPTPTATNALPVCIDTRPAVGVVQPLDLCRDELAQARASFSLATM